MDEDAPEEDSRHVYADADEEIEEAEGHSPDSPTPILDIDEDVYDVIDDGGERSWLVGAVVSLSIVGAVVCAYLNQPVTAEGLTIGAIVVTLTYLLQG